MKLSVRSRVTYSLGGISDAANFTFVNNYLMFFLTAYAGIRPSAAGSITGIATMLSALWGPVVGYLSDHVRSRLGKRRLFILLAMIPYFLAVILCFTVAKGSDGFKNFYYGLMVVVFWSSFSTFYSPWLALGAAYTSDFDERLKLRETTYAITQVGSIFGVAVTPIAVGKFEALGIPSERAWQYMAAIIGLIGFICLGTVFLTSKDHDPSTADVPAYDFSLKDMIMEYWGALTLKPMLWIAASCLFFITAQGIINADRIYYMNYNLGLDPKLQSFVVLIPCVLSMVIVRVATFVSRKKDKNFTIMLFSLISAGGFAVMLIFAGDGLLSVIGAVVIFGFSSNAFWQLTPSMNYDVCEYDCYYNGKRREGIVTSLQNSLEMVCSGMASLILGWILQISGFVEGAEVQTASALAGIRICLFAAPAVLLVGCAYTMYKYPLKKEKLLEITKKLEERRELH